MLRLYVESYAQLESFVTLISQQSLIILRTKELVFLRASVSPWWIYGSADGCISTVDHVLSAAWQIFSSGHSAHFGFLATHSARP
jgi:hypothetical protein